MSKPRYKGYWPYAPRYGKQSTTQSNTRAIGKLRKQLGQVEIKFADKTVDDSLISATGTVQGQLFVIPEGDGQSDRHGRKIQLKSFQWRGQISLPSSGTVGEGSDSVRMIVLKDNSANGALPAVLDILVLEDWESFKNLENVSRFTTLLDRTMSLCTGGLASTPLTAPVERAFNYYRKFDIPIEYNDSATTGVIATINTNNVVMLLLSRQGKLIINSCVRFRYTDM